MNKWYKSIIPGWGFSPPGDPSAISSGTNQFATEGTPLPEAPTEPLSSPAPVPSGFEVVNPAEISALQKPVNLFGKPVLVPALPAIREELPPSPGTLIPGVVAPGPMGTYSQAAVKERPEWISPIETEKLPGYARIKSYLEADPIGKGVAKLSDVFTDEGNVVSAATNLMPMPGAAPGIAASKFAPIVFGLFGGARARGFAKAKNVFSHIADQMPRFEISDALSKMRSPETWALKGAEGKLISKPGTTLRDIIDHPELFDNYPAFGDIKVNFKYDPRGAQKAERASYNPSTNTISMYQLKGSREDLLHEIQHAIQQYEGFAKGGSYRDMPKYLAAADTILQNKMSDPELVSWAKKIVDIAGDSTQPAMDRSFKMYKALLGEIEAGHVEFRALFSPEELKKITPFSATPELERTLVKKESVVPKKETAARQYTFDEFIADKGINPKTYDPKTTPAARGTTHEELVADWKDYNEALARTAGREKQTLDYRGQGVKRVGTPEYGFLREPKYPKMGKEVLPGSERVVQAPEGQPERLEGLMRRETPELLAGEYEAAGFTEAAAARREASFGPSVERPIPTRTGQAVTLEDSASNWVMNKVDELGEVGAVQNMIDRGIVQDVAAGKKLVQDAKSTYSPEARKINKEMGPSISGDLGVRPAKDGTLQISNEIPLTGTVVEEGATRYGEEWFKKIREANKKNPTYSEEQLAKFEADVTSIAAQLDRGGKLPTPMLDPNTGRPLYSPVKGNRFEGYKFGEPGDSADVTSICPKSRALLSELADRQIKAGRAFNKEELYALREELKNKGVPVSCGACYTARGEMGDVVNKVIQQHPEMIKELFLSQEGLDYLKAYFPEVYSDFGKLMGPRGVKLPESYAPIDGQILKMSQKKVDGYNSRRFFRFQSWSDLEVPHVLDLMKAASETDVQKLATYGYTKVPDYVDVMGPTDQFINQSTMPAGKTGLDKAGNLIFDDVEGMPHQIAFANREKFPGTVGVELMGISDEQIRVAMKDPRIDTIIPYHRSSLGRELREKYVAQGWVDYQGLQEEMYMGSKKWPGTKEGKLAKKKYIDGLREEVDWYTIANKNKGKTPEAIAEIYKKECKKRDLTPKFEKFSNDEGYYKLLVDRKQYNHATRELTKFTHTKPNFDMDAINRIVNKYLEGAWSPYKTSAP